jgi:uncharacterized membrane protein YeaQ/YmgE (transglycosylase-associated protein family)
MALEPGGLIAWLIVGLIAGWLAGQFMKGGGYGLVGDIIVGVVGAFIGGFLTSLLGLSAGPARPRNTRSPVRTAVRLSQRPRRHLRSTVAPTRRPGRCRVWGRFPFGPTGIGRSTESGAGGVV